ncbi:hypothetical protein [Actinotalea solisilvae]|uniref:hypothetical protein n=1 Tax=Actinotalea solisilvae TaxID=2072922 RepID=UPI0018F126F8|nr:hypothetical protein [Actinotalea solisilvae]
MAAPAAPARRLGTVCWDFLLTRPERSDKGKGTQVHRVIREQLVRWFRDAGYGERVPVGLPDASYEQYTSRNRVMAGGSGTVDLAYRTRESQSVVGFIEIKPANLEGLAHGEAQVDNYVDKANANDALKRRLTATAFLRLPPSAIDPPLPLVVWQSRYFEVRWCVPGLIFYKEIRTKDDEDKEKEKEKEKRTAQEKPRDKGARSAAEAQPADPRATAGARQIVLPNGIKIDVFYRPWQAPSWMPAELRDAVQNGTLRDGVYRDLYRAPYLRGFSSNVVVYVKTTALGREYQFYREFPTDPQYYEDLARRRGLSGWQTRLVQSTLTTTNQDMWSLVRPDREDPRDLDTARDELRGIYDGILRQVFEANISILGTGVAAGAVNNAARSAGAFQRGTAGRSIGPQAPAGVRPAPGVVPPARIPAPAENAYVFEQVLQDLRIHLR